MDCSRVETLLALFSGDDLDARQAEAVRVHMAQCAACQAQTDEWMASRAWLQAAPPPEFDEAFYAELRQAVWRELPTVKCTGGRFDWLAGWFLQWRWQPVLALAAMLLCLVGWAVYRFNAGQPVNNNSGEVTATQTPVAPSAPAFDVVASKAEHVQPYKRSARLAHRVATVPRPTPPVIVAVNDQTVAANTQTTTAAQPRPANEPIVTRLEIQTADPNIRIIWLTPVQGAATTEPQAR